MRNIHERVIPAPPEQVGALLDTVGSHGDRLWPRPPRAPMVLRHPGGTGVAPGATGGHGRIRYTVLDHEPGRRVAFRFDDDDVALDGGHVLTATPAPGGGTLLRHELDAVASGGMRVLVPLVVRSLHDCYVEDAFDRVERELGVGPAHEHRHSPWAALLERRLRRRVLEVAPVRSGLGRDALSRVDAADAYATDLLPGDGTDPVAWARDLLAAVPPWLRLPLRVGGALTRARGGPTESSPAATLFPLVERTATEALLGDEGPDLDVRIVTTVDEAAALVTMTTLVRLPTPRGRAYWGVVRHLHPVAARALVRGAVHPAGVPAPRATPTPTTPATPPAVVEVRP